MVTGRQIREARHMLGWDVEVLSDKAQVSGTVIEGAEIDREGDDLTRFHVARIQMALERGRCSLWPERCGVDGHPQRALTADQPCDDGALDPYACRAAACTAATTGPRSKRVSPSWPIGSRPRTDVASGRKPRPS